MLFPMSLRLYSLIGLAAIVVSIVARAQETKVTHPPAAPLVTPAPEYADSTVTVKYPTEPTPPPHAPKHHDWRYVEVHSTKAGKLKRDLLTSRDGIKSEKWFVDSILLWTTPDGKVSVSDTSGAPPSMPEDPNPSVPHGFPGVAWISLENFVGEVIYQKQVCYHYVAEGTEAWIDVESKLPVAYQSAGTLYQFKFNPPPTEPLTMPPAYQKALDTVSQMRNRPS